MSVSPMFPQLPPPPRPVRVSIPPPPPLEPRYQNPQHIVHVLLTLCSFGLWLPIWILCAYSAERYNSRARAGYEQAYLAWQQAYWAWSHGA